MSYRQAARLMINKHGRNARAWALKRAAELRAEDKLEAAELWVKVGEEVAVQQAEALVGGGRLRPTTPRSGRSAPRTAAAPRA